VRALEILEGLLRSRTCPIVSAKKCSPTSFGNGGMHQFRWRIISQIVPDREEVEMRLCTVRGEQVRCGVLLVLLALVLLILLPVSLQAATFTVTNYNDTGPGSLRFAMIQANGSVGADMIDFNIPGIGPHRIRPQSPLPALTDRDGVMIDGFTQPFSSSGANPPSTATLMIELLGASAGLCPGFHIQSPNNTIQGIVIDSFAQDGIRIEGTEEGTYWNFIFCNFIGTGVGGGFDCGNGYSQTSLWAGVNIVVIPYPTPTYTYENTVEGNLISGNYAEGVGIASCPPGDVYRNTVSNNYIGTDVSGTVDLGNDHTGVYIGEGAHHNFIDGNLISGNDFQGISIVGYAELAIHTDTNYVFQNTIGLSSSLAPLQNTLDGVTIGVYGSTYYFGGHARGNEIGPNNTIAYNGRHGVMIWEHSADNTNADGNRITSNSIYSNTGLGIDLADDGVSPNDPGDPDTGPDQELNFPTITSAVDSGGQTRISGTVDIDSNPIQALVEVFKARPDGSGYGEGEHYVGQTSPDGSGNWTFLASGLVAGDSVTATVSDVHGNTSEFSGLLGVVQVEEEETAVIRRGELALAITPNPFHYRVSLHYLLGLEGRIKLTVCDAAGALVAVLVDEEKGPGAYRVTWSPENISQGIYFCRLSSGEREIVRKLVFLR
jgi:hypothetical protein